MVPAVEVFGLGEVGVATQTHALEAAAEADGQGSIHLLGRSFVRRPIPRTIDHAQDFVGVGQAQHQRVVPPGAVVGDVHAAFTRTGRGQIVRHEHDAAYRQRRVVPRLRKLVVAHRRRRRGSAGRGWSRHSAPRRAPPARTRRRAGRGFPPVPPRSRRRWRRPAQRFPSRSLTTNAAPAADK